MWHKLKNVIFLSFFYTLHVNTNDVTICTINVKGGYLPYEYRRSGPAVDIALEKIRAQYSNVFNVNYIYKDAGTDCTENGFGAIAADVYYNNQIDAFIGPG